jgi:hypothetical protein
MLEFITLLMPLIMSLLDKSKAEQVEVLTLYKAILIDSDKPEDVLSMKLAECFVNEKTPAEQSEIFAALQQGGDALASLSAKRAARRAK